MPDYKIKCRKTQNNKIQWAVVLGNKVISVHSTRDLAASHIDDYEMQDRCDDDRVKQAMGWI